MISRHHNYNVEYSITFCLPMKTNLRHQIFEKQNMISTILLFMDNIC